MAEWCRLSATVMIVVHIVGVVVVIVVIRVDEALLL